MSTEFEDVIEELQIVLKAIIANEAKYSTGNIWDLKKLDEDFPGHGFIYSTNETVERMIKEMKADMTPMIIQGHGMVLLEKEPTPEELEEFQKLRVSKLLTEPDNPNAYNPK